MRLTIAALIWLVVATTLASCSSAATRTVTGPTASGGTTSSAAKAPTPSAIETATPGVTEGPYYKAGSPERTSILETGTTGTVLMLKGRVVDTSGNAIARARLEFWQADENGGYDNTSYRYRGHQFTKSDGSYQLITVIPGLYPGPDSAYPRQGDRAG